MSGAQQTDQDPVHDALLADDYLGDLVADLVEFGYRRADGGFGRHGFDSNR